MKKSFEECLKEALEKIQVCEEGIRSTEEETRLKATKELTEYTLQIHQELMNYKFMNTLKKVKVYQAPNQTVYAKNETGPVTGNYASLEELQLVYSCNRRMQEDIRILNDITEKLTDSKAIYPINYYLSVGDIVQIDNNYYRCLPKGWAKITL